MKSKIRLDLLFAITGTILFLLVSFLFSSALDINFRDTYFVLAPFHAGFLILILFLFFGMFHFIFLQLKRPLRRSLGLVHYAVTTITILIFIFSPVIIPNVHHRFNPENEAFSSLNAINLIITLAFISCVLVQVIFLINLCLTIFYKHSKNN